MAAAAAAANSSLSATTYANMAAGGNMTPLAEGALSDSKYQKNRMKIKNGMSESPSKQSPPFAANSAISMMANLVANSQKENNNMTPQPIQPPGNSSLSIHNAKSIKITIEEGGKNNGTGGEKVIIQSTIKGNPVHEGQTTKYPSILGNKNKVSVDSTNSPLPPS